LGPSGSFDSAQLDGAAPRTSLAASAVVVIGYAVLVLLFWFAGPRR
jgi:hypothetical protein